MVKIKFGHLFIRHPNMKNSIVAVKIYDIHHVFTGYHADSHREAKIAHKQIGSGLLDA